MNKYNIPAKLIEENGNIKRENAQLLQQNKELREALEEIRMYGDSTSVGIAKSTLSKHPNKENNETSY